MLSQAVIVQNNKVLMVQQYVQRGALVWNFPGGGIEEGETPKEACKREVFEETGYHVQVLDLLHNDGDKYTYLAKIIGGSLVLDKTNIDNEDLIDNGWVNVEDIEKWDKYTLPILNKYFKYIKTLNTVEG